MADVPSDTLTVRYFAAAAAAAGRDDESRPAGRTVADVLAAAYADHPALARVGAACTFLLDGRAAAPSDLAAPGATLDVLPPFAGG